MAQASSSLRLDIHADKVWDLIGGFGSLPNWLPYIPKSRLTEGGRVRHLATPDGSVIVERLMSFDEKQRSYSYHILQAPFPITDYLSTLRVSDLGLRSEVTWSAHFEPKGVSQETASEIFQNIFDEGLKAIAAHFKA